MLQYERRFVRFLQWLGFENNADVFLKKAKGDKKWTESKTIDYIIMQKQRVTKGEMSDSTVANFKKPVKLFLRMNDVKLKRVKIGKILPPMRRYANDRARTVEEIRKIITCPDMRAEAIVLTMASSGIRVGAWNYLKLGNIKRIERDGKVVACRVTVYAGTPEEYTTFITRQAYTSIQRYLRYRELHGEQLTLNSPLIRNLFNTSKAIESWNGKLRRNLVLL